MFSQISCSECEDRIIAYYFGWLDPIERSQFRQHMETCKSCREIWKGFLSSMLWNRNNLEKTFHFTSLSYRLENYNCFSVVTLRKYLRGMLTSEENTIIDRHIFGCKNCKRTIYFYTTGNTFKNGTLEDESSLSLVKVLDIDLSSYFSEFKTSTPNTFKEEYSKFEEDLDVNYFSRFIYGSKENTEDIASRSFIERIIQRAKYLDIFRAKEGEIETFDIVGLLEDVDNYGFDKNYRICFLPSSNPADVYCQLYFRNRETLSEWRIKVQLFFNNEFIEIGESDKFGRVIFTLPIRKWMLPKISLNINIWISLSFLPYKLSEEYI
ncbi:MAG: zf-HC2 domain-containing protein [Nitrososphaeria archaeon]